MNGCFVHPGASPAIRAREILGRPAAEHLKEALRDARAASGWRIELPDSLLFDRAGLRLLARAVDGYRGRASRLSFWLKPDPDAWRDYYSLQALESEEIPLMVFAERAGGDGGEERLSVPLPARHYEMAFPSGIAAPCRVAVPRALLLPMRNDFDPLFANQIAHLADLESRVARSPWTWIKALRPGAPGRGAARKLGLAWSNVHRTADVHPTAVVEGSTVGPGARIGAYCVVRYSTVGERAQIFDGAKVELAVVGSRSWLMHDLVLYRSVAESDVFLIHGPYQFSYFRRGSGAFGTILADYRPDRRPIQVETPDGRVAYAGPFLGSVYGEGAKSLGGSVIAPGRVIPDGVWLGAEPSSVHLLSRRGLGTHAPLAPAQTRAERVDPTSGRLQESPGTPEGPAVAEERDRRPQVVDQVIALPHREHAQHRRQHDAGGS